jgi:MFS family permease
MVLELVASKDDGTHPSEVALFTNWMFPIITNSTFLFTPLIGFLIDSNGFVLPMSLLVLVTVSTILCAWLPTVHTLYALLLAVNWLQTIAYAIQFAYIRCSLLTVHSINSALYH